MLFAVGHAERGTKVGVESAVVDAVVDVAEFTEVVVGSVAAIVRTPPEDCDVVDDGLEVCEYTAVRQISSVTYELSLASASVLVA